MKFLKSVFLPVQGKPFKFTLKHTLQCMQVLVGGLIEIFPFDNELVIVCDEEAKLKQKMGNRMVNGQIIAGDFFVLAVDSDGELAEMNEVQVERITKFFDAPELYTAEEVERDLIIRFIPF